MQQITNTALITLSFPTKKIYCINLLTFNLTNKLFTDINVIIVFHIQLNTIGEKHFVSY